MLRENALKTDRDRRVAPENLSALREAGLLRMTAPSRYGGYEATTVTQIEALTEIARGCGSSSWVAAVYSVGAWTVALLDDEAHEDVFGSVGPDACVTLVAAPTAGAERAQGGYRVTGTWRFNTGCLDAHWALLGVPLGDPTERGSRTVMLIPYSELDIHDDWHVSGLRGTGSNSVSAKNVFVPDHRVLALDDAAEGRYPTKLNAQTPLYRVLFGAFVAANSVGTPLGLGRAAMDAFHERLPGRGITYTQYADQREAAVTHLQAGQAQILLDSAAMHAYRAAALVDAKAAADEPYTMLERAQVRMDLGWVTALARDATRIVQGASGASSIHEDVPIQRISRDIEALSLHAILHLDTNLELYGRVLLGLEPQTLFL